MDLLILNLGTLKLEGPEGVRLNVFFDGTLIRYDTQKHAHRHTNTHSTLRGQ